MKRRPPRPIVAALVPLLVLAACSSSGGDDGAAEIDEPVTVTGDVTDEVHVHGYDLFAPIAPGQPATIRFDADIPGVFEVELEGSHVLILELEIS